jgi:hypothetical protein
VQTLEVVGEEVRNREQLFHHCNQQYGLLLVAMVDLASLSFLTLPH